MENQKLENLLNPALEATPRERELSENLQIGYNPEEQTWELIVKHSEPLPDLTEMGVEIRQLLNNYAIIIVPESQIDRITGKNTLVAVIDSGIDYFHEDFRNEDGTTRIVELWDQTLDRVFTQEEINEALAAGNPIAARSLVPSW